MLHPPHSSSPRQPQDEDASSSNRGPGDQAELVIRSASLQRVMRLAEKVARHPAAVLIVGETGTGKEMIARTIHNHSLRSNSPCVDVNCAAIPEHLVESELFGYEKGAFSGADALKPGMFEMANKGTLFLDEIGDLDLKIQVKLLRVLDGVPYYRLGGNKKVTVDVRVVAATNQNLEDLVRSGRFRSDLYHRLAQFKLEVPPLRERPEDVLGIAEQVLHEHYPESRFRRDAVDALLCYAWPGNVRELKNVVFGAVLQAKNAHREITSADLRFPDSTANNRRISTDADLDQVEKRAILQALDKCDGNQGKAAEALGISRRTLIRKLKVYRTAGLDDSSGTLSLSQQRYYRAQLEMPIKMKYAGEQFEATLLNISAGGAGTKTDRPLKSGAPVALIFSVPGSTSEGETEFPGRVTWTNKGGQYGVQFGDLTGPQRTGLQRWLRAEMKKDGWGVETRE
ncbi:MAG TPA: sigma 54-interacting transcriptional regulator [Candidatus Angelobacter sp.]